MILDDILEHRKVQLVKEKDEISPRDMLKQIEKLNLKKGKSFLQAIDDYPGMAIIAEVKKASPSKGVIKQDFNPLSIAKEYEASTVQCLSVLTEEHYFMGNNHYLKEIAKANALPILRKDFIFDEYQVYHAKLLGASAILLIAAMLDEKSIRKFSGIADELQLDVLTEVHNREEINKSLSDRTRILGINNRNLKNFHTTIDTTLELIEYVPSNVTAVSESGIMDKNDVKKLLGCGVKGILVGESLMRANSISAKIDELREGE